MTHDFERAFKKLDEFGPAGLVFEVGYEEIKAALLIAQKVTGEPSEGMIKAGWQTNGDPGQTFKDMVAQLLKEIEE